MNVGSLQGFWKRKWRLLFRVLLLKGLNIRSPIIIPINGRGFINHGSTFGILTGQFSRPSLSLSKDRSKTSILRTKNSCIHAWRQARPSATLHKTGGPKYGPPYGPQRIIDLRGTPNFETWECCGGVAGVGLLRCARSR